MPQIHRLNCNIPTNSLLSALIYTLGSQPGFAVVRAASGFGEPHQLATDCTLVYLEPHAKLCARVDSYQVDDLIAATSTTTPASTLTSWSDALDQFIARHQTEQHAARLPAAILVAITYEAGTTFEHIIDLPAQTELACAFAYASVLVLPDDQSKPPLRVCFNQNTRSCAEFDAWLHQISTNLPPPIDTSEESEFYQELPLPAYVQGVEAIKHAIKNGEVYQVNLTQRIKIAAPSNANCLITSIFNQNPASHAFVLRLDSSRLIISASPELFIARQGDRIVSEPIKGTCKRSDDQQRDNELWATLMESEKDQAELAMIVDLIRNDMGRLAVADSVRVEKHAALMTLPYVYHLYSRVVASVPPQTTLSQILAATFPCGSITGAPKIAAMQMIAHLERSARGYYCGALGYIRNHSDFSLNVAIRSGLLTSDGFTFGAGGGVVYDSDGDSEYAECMAKAKVFLKK